MVIMASYLEVPGTMITMLEFHYVRTEFVFDQDLRNRVEFGLETGENNYHVAGQLYIAPQNIRLSDSNSQ